MHILAIGLNFRTAPVEIREKFTFTSHQLPDALAELCETKSVLECVIVATCNRTEIYTVVDRMHHNGHFVRGFMEKWFGLPREQFDSYLYMYEDRQAIEHLFRVTSGLDSMIIGETQILGQVRDAFLLAQQRKTTGTLFNMLFKQAVTLAKRAHSETSIGDNPVSVSYAAVELGKRIFGSFAQKTVLIIGAGKMSELTAKHLHASGADRILVVNRTYEKAVELAGKFRGQAFAIEQLTRCLAEADVVISSTGAEGLVLTKEDVQKAQPQRKSRPLFMVDIAVPRDLDPAIGSLSNVYLYDIDDLEHIVEDNLAERKQEAVRIEAMIAQEIAAFEQWLKTLGVTPVIKALQTKSNDIYEETLSSMLKKLPDLDEREIKVIRKLTKSIVNQMMRDPILRIKELSAGRHGDEALELFAHLFALEPYLEEERRREKRVETSAVSEQDRTGERAVLPGFSSKEMLAGS